MVNSAYTLSWILFLFWRPITLVLSQSSTSLNPPSIPIVLRSPYFNAWVSTLPSNTSSSTTNAPDLGGVRLWNAQTVGWVGFIRIDGTAYGWLGVGGDNRTITLGSYVTPTQTILALRSGPVDYNVTFLSPVEPADWARQSFPFSYLTIDITSSDGSEHDIQVYVHLTGEWISSDLNTTTRSSTTRGDSVVYLTTTRTTPSLFVEENEVAEDETLILACANSNMITSQAGASSTIRSAFSQTGQLSNAVDESDTPISPSFPAIAFSLDLGKITSTPSPSPALFALGIVRDPDIRYVHGSTADLRRPYWTTQWSNISDALDAFFADYPAALVRAQTLDAKIMADARTAASTQYADLVALSVRQFFASMDITVGPSGDAKAFMKDVGIGTRTNAVNTLYAAFPALLYFNASLGGILLDPLLESQSTPDYQHAFAGPDLGSAFPISAVNNSDTQTLAVDSCASMLIMSWLYTQNSGNGTLVNTYYTLLKQWADYLVINTLQPVGFSSSDGLTNPDNSNLALKGILAIYAMAQINNAMEGLGMKSSVTQYYANISQTYFSSWETQAFSSGRMSSSYNQPSSWALAYNLFPAKLMGVEFVGKNVYDGQTSFYSSEFASSGSKFGLGYDSNDQYIVKSQWSLFTAATVTSTTVRDSFISGVHNRSFMSGTVPPFSTTWDLRSGASPPAPAPDGRASGAQGAMLSLLALNLPTTPPKISFDGLASSKKANVGAIVGGVVGGLLVLGVIIFLFFFFARRRKQSARQEKAPAAGLLILPTIDSPSTASIMHPASVTTTQSTFSRYLSSRGHESSPALVPIPFSMSAALTTSNASVPEGHRPALTSLPASSEEKRALREYFASVRLRENAAGSPSALSSGSLPLSPGSEEGPSPAGLSYVSQSDGPRSTTPSTPPVNLEISTEGRPGWSESSDSPKQMRGKKNGRRQRHQHQQHSNSSTGTLAESPIVNRPAAALNGGLSSAEDLRAEVITLRMQMAEIQATMGSEARRDEPPPSYVG